MTVKLTLFQASCRYFFASPIRRLVFYWALSVVFASVIYWVAWLLRPDSFILNDEFNLTPYDRLVSLYLSPDVSSEQDAETQPTYSESMNLADLDRFVSQTRQLNQELQIELTSIASERKKLEAEQARLYDIHSAKMWKEAEEYRAKVVVPEKAAVSEAKKLVRRLQLIADSSRSPENLVTLANAKYALAEANLALALKEAEASDFVLKNLRSFGDLKALAEANSIRERLLQLSQRDFEANGELGDLRAKGNEVLGKWRSQRADRLGWIDFVYFSLGVSTSTTFGDVIPNSRLIRVAVLVQLVVSLILVGILVSRMADSSRVSKS